MERWGFCGEEGVHRDNFCVKYVNTGQDITERLYVCERCVSVIKAVLEDKHFRESPD